jgi:IS30 family transposase
VTIVERVTKLNFFAQVNTRSSADVTLTTIKLLKPYVRVVHRVPAANGKAFTYHEEINKA